MIHKDMKANNSHYPDIHKAHFLDKMQKLKENQKVEGTMENTDLKTAYN